jgi:surface polysaccharide O-acyltransferase-like enzyme
MAEKRNNSIEFLRDLLMLGICILHSCSLGGYRTGWVCRLLCPCVPCFIFISGYYGIKATPVRIAKLIGTAFACVPVIGIVSWFLGYQGLDGFVIGAKGVADNWFVWAYVGLMCFAPALNHAIDSEKRLALTLPIIVMCLGWGYIKGLPWFRMFMPTTDGLGGYTFTMMVGTYCVARLCRRYDICNIITTKSLLISFVGLTALCVIGFSAYCSPVSVFWSAILFSLFLKIKVNGQFGAVAAFVAKSTFPIFVLHANGVGFELMRKFASLLCSGCGMTAYVMYLVMGLTVFVAGLLLDMPRRAIGWMCRRFFLGGSRK